MSADLLPSAPKTPAASRGRPFWGPPLTCGGWAVPHSLPVFLHAFLEVGELQGLGDELLRIAVNNRVPAGRKASQATGPGVASSRHPSACLESTYGRDPQKVLHIKSEGQVPETPGGPILHVWTLPSQPSRGGGGGGGVSEQVLNSFSPSLHLSSKPHEPGTTDLRGRVLRATPTSTHSKPLAAPRPSRAVTTKNISRRCLTSLGSQRKGGERSRRPWWTRTAHEQWLAW